jgi:PAS domain S-box-containing protein
MSSTTDNLSLFRFVIEQAPDAIIFADQQGVIRIWNNAAADLFGYLAEEAVGQTLDIIVPADLRQAHWAGFRTAVASGHTKHGRGAMKTRATHKTGQKQYVSLAFAVVKDRDGKVLGAMATAREFIADKTQ